MKSLTQSASLRTRITRSFTARMLMAVALAGVSVTACKNDSTDPGRLSTLAVSPNPTTVAPNGTVQFTAAGTDFTGESVTPNPGAIVWSVTGGGSIDSRTGLFTAGSVAGTTSTVVATCRGIAASATVTVVAGPLATITVTPNPTLPINTTQQFTAVGRDAQGNVVAITPVWSVTNGGGTINASTGLFTAGGATGTFPNTVRATSGSIFGTATVTVTSPATPIVNLGTASTYGILAGSTVTCASAPGTVNADVGVSPGSALTGFPPCTITGQTHLADAAAAQAQNDLTTAYNTLAGLPCGTVVGTANIGGTTRAPGVYCSGTSILVTGDLTLDGGGDPNAVFVFQAGSTITTAGNVVLINGAQAKNVYFQVGSSATIGGGPAIWQGNILALTSITLNNNVTLNGRALARNGAVTLGTGNTINLP